MIPEADAADWLTAGANDIRPLYDSLFVEAVCDAFPPIKAYDLAAIQGGLLYAGAIYSAQVNSNAAPAEWRERQDQLRLVLRLTEKLTRALNDISPYVMEILSRSERAIDFAAMVSAADAHDCLGEFPEPTSEALLLESNCHMGIGSSIKSLDALRGAAEASLHAIQAARPKGAPRRGALLTWAFNMEQIWRQSFGHRFTLSVKDGPSTALRFCVAVMAPLDPTVKQGTIANKMSGVIRHYRRIEDRRKAAQNAGG